MSARPETEAGTNPVLVLLLSEPSAGTPARAFTDVLAARIGAAGRHRVLALGELRRAGLEASATHPLYRVELERFIAREIAVLLDGPFAPRARVPLFVVGNLSETPGRRHAWSLVPVLYGALARVALPRGVDPLVAGIWTLPAAWSPADGVELYAWLKEFTRAIRPPANGNGAGWRYTLTAVLGRSDAHEAAQAEAVTRGDTDRMSRAAELIAACSSSRLLDWVLAAQRGHPRAHGFHVFGIQPLVRNGNGAAHDLARAIEDSRVLWPVEASATARHAEVARAVAGDALERDMLHDFEPIEPLNRSGAVRASWLVQMAHGFEPREIIGARNWRRFYDLMSLEQRDTAHSSPDAASWPDPLEAPAAVKPLRVPDDPPPFLG